MTGRAPDVPDAHVELKLSTDEALVLFQFLTRELWEHGEARLKPCFEHPAEQHALRALQQELIEPLLWSGAPETADAIFAGACERLLARHS